MNASDRHRTSRYAHHAVTTLMALAAVLATAAPVWAGVTKKESVASKPSPPRGDTVRSPDVPPLNDDFADARLITGSGGTVAGRNTGATGETGEPDNAGRSAPIQSVWYSWTAPDDGSWTFDTCGSDFDTTLGVYTGPSVSDLAEVGSNDDFCDQQSSLTFRAAGGTAYGISVDGFQTRMGNITLNWIFVPAPPNDAFGHPQMLTGASGSVSGTNLAATGQPGEPSNAGDSEPIQSA